MKRVWFAAAIATSVAIGTGLTGLKLLPANLTEVASSSFGSGAVGDGAVGDGAFGNTALGHYRGAIGFSERAIAEDNNAEAAESASVRLAHLKKGQALWRAAVERLGAIPQDSELYERAVNKRLAYRDRLIESDQKLAQADQRLVADIVTEVETTLGRPSSEGASPVHVTLCQIAPEQKLEKEAPEKDVSKKEAAQPKKTELKGRQKLNSTVAVPKQKTAKPKKPREKAESKREPLELTADGQLNPKQCRHFQGDTPMASAASLIKLPIAVALLAKIKRENLDLDDKLYIEPGNFTENSAGASIEIGNEYPLRKVMAQMIQESDNVATNQLIDYLGYDAMNKTMRSLNYPQTRIGHKLIGAEAAPADFGEGINQTTTNDITAMMANIYGLNRPGDEEILTALSNQQDWELGYEGLKEVRLQAKWLGEKTGQNNLVIATTMAMAIGEERYVLTVAIDEDSDIYALREIVGGVAEHLVMQGALVTP
ncbi:MAG: serine hydrolase [Cyanobacteria bacterium J06635_11]